MPCWSARMKIIGSTIQQAFSDRVVLKLTKPPYATENLGYDSVWDIFSKDKTSRANQQQVTVNDAAITRLAIGILRNTRPEVDDWEALLYS